MDAHATLTPMKCKRFVRLHWRSEFKRWMETQEQESLERLREVRKDAFKLVVNGAEFMAWAPTVLNQVVNLERRVVYTSAVVYKCFGKHTNFDVVCDRTPPYAMHSVVVDLVEGMGVGTAADKEVLEIMAFATKYGLRLVKHPISLRIEGRNLQLDYFSYSPASRSRRYAFEAI